MRPADARLLDNSLPACMAAPFVSPAFSYRSRMYLAPTLGSGMQSSQGNEPWPVVLLNGGSLGSANVHLCKMA